MKWSNILRRWTMRSIHAAILGSALWGSASMTIAQPSGAPANKSANIHYTRNQSFNLPVVMPDSDRAALSEIRLYVKTPTSAWALQERGGPELKHFNCKATQDGEYWYSLATVDRQGRMSPADVNLEAPSQRVVVDTAAPVIQVQSWNSPEGDFCLRCTVHDANPDPTTLKAVCKSDGGDIPLEVVPNQPGVFRVKGAALMRFPVVVSAMDLAKNVGTKEVNVGEMIGSTLKNPEVSHVIGVQADKGITPLPPPKIDTPPTNFEVPPKIDTQAKIDGPPPRYDGPPRFDTPPPLKNDGTGPAKTIDFPASPPVQPSGEKLGTVANKVAPLNVEPGNPLSGPHQMISNTHATVDYRIDQVGPSGVGKVEIYMTPDKGQSWHRLGEDADKRSPADITLPGDGVYGIRIIVTNGNGFGGRAPVRGDAPHCTIEVDTTSPFVQLRSTEVLPSSGHVELRWNATDKNLGAEPISLFYRTRPDGPWQVIARGLKNDGVHRWAFPRDSGAQFFFKIEATDLAGNASQDVSRQPVVIDMTEPQATIVGVTSSGARPK